MGFGAKTALVIILAVICGGTLALWSQFGGGVYAAYLAGALMNCF